jgi:hypothetical protein
MKQFVPHPGGNVEGVLFDTEAQTRCAVFLTPGQAKFIASFQGVREAQRR